MDRIRPPNAHWGSPIAVRAVHFWSCDDRYGSPRVGDLQSKSVQTTTSSKVATRRDRMDAEQVVSLTYNMQQSTVWLTRNNMHYQERKMMNRGHINNRLRLQLRYGHGWNGDASPQQLGVDTQLLIVYRSCRV